MPLAADAVYIFTKVVGGGRIKAVFFLVGNLLHIFTLGCVVCYRSVVLKRIKHLA
ncbi:hypothetical protein DSUL_100119 [Desulfovibrionales bacterium]